MENNVEIYINKLKSYEVTKLLETWILTENIDKVILGIEPFSVTTRWDSGPVNTSQILWVLDMLLRERKITNQEINDSFSRIKIKIDDISVCIFLSYFYDYLLHKKNANNLKNYINIDFTNIVEQIKENMSEFENQYCVRYFTQKINEESGERIFPDISI